MLINDSDSVTPNDEALEFVKNFFDNLTEEDVIYLWKYNLFFVHHIYWYFPPSTYELSLMSLVVVQLEIPLETVMRSKTDESAIIQ
jgi:hypothetical protein